tara:strand:+ start:6572 stop:7585 length:1014 start_codon:yes stop_codon:yes gene_type:complete
MRHIPHELARQDRVITCWPADAELWEDNLAPAQAEFAAFLSDLVAADDSGRRLPLTVFCATGQAAESARAALGEAADIRREPYGDVWARDTGPVFAREGSGLVAVRFGFNGWGGKYQLADDDTVAERAASLAGATLDRRDLVIEGGALEFDGEGTVLTTRQCLLNPNRNPGLTEADAESRLKAALGVSKVLWLDEGLLFDHTDGHIDNVARFAGPGVVVCQAPLGDDDPQAEVLDACARQLESMTDAKGRRLKVERIASPGLVAGEDGDPRPASHMNWVIGPKNLVVPTYGTPSAAQAVSDLQKIFPSRQVIGRPSSSILSGGGAFHCVTCHIPSGG